MKKGIIIKLLFIVAILVILLPVTKTLAVMKNNNPLLREITIDGKEIEPEFDQFITDYVLAVDSNKEEVDIEVVTDDPNATAEIIGNKKLKVGVNDFEIKVTAEDGITTNSYFIHITRGNVEKANANLKNIEVEGLDLNPKFNEKDTNYYLEYEGYIEKLKITATPENINSKVEILNNENFNSTLHIVTIKVTAEDGITTKEYKLTVKKANEDTENPSGFEEYEEYSENQKEEKTINVIYVTIGTAIITVVVIGIVIFIVKKGKKK